MAEFSDDALRSLIRTDPEAGWRAFIDHYTPLIVGLIRRAGLDDRDEMMEVYVLICERLSARGFERLKNQDAARGSIGGWLAVLTRHAAVDWIRSRRGRRRVFRSIRDLGPFDEHVFERYYWDEHTPAEIAELLHADLANVLQSLERIQFRLSDRHRAELMSLAFRARSPVAIDEAADDLADSRLDPEAQTRVAEINERFESALKTLPSEEAAIVRLKFVEGLSNPEIERFLGTSMTSGRIRDILGRLRAALADRGIDHRDIELLRGTP